eukprot:147663_1
MGDNLLAIDLGTGFIPMQIMAGAYHMCALSTANKIKCWGMNDHGELGAGDTNNRGDEANEMGDDLLAIDLGSIPTSGPTPIRSPSSAPTTSPSSAPSSVPTTSPSGAPTRAPSSPPSNVPSIAPSNVPSIAPSSAPSDAPSHPPSVAPSYAPSSAPSYAPSSAPNHAPSHAPSNAPTYAPSIAPSNAPSSAPSNAPSSTPSHAPSVAPSSAPSDAPTTPAPVDDPTRAPTADPIPAPNLIQNTTVYVQTFTTHAQEKDAEVMDTSIDNPLYTKHKYEMNGVLMYIIIAAGVCCMFVIALILIKRTRRKYQGDGYDKAQVISSNSPSDAMKRMKHQRVPTESRHVNVQWADDEKIEELFVPMNKEESGVKYGDPVVPGGHNKDSVSSSDSSELYVPVNNRPGVSTATIQMEPNQYCSHHNGALNANNREDGIVNWLKSLSLSQYADTFAVNGYETMDFVKEINDVQQLEDIGIVLKGHQVKIINAIKRLPLRKDVNHNVIEEEGAQTDYL